MRSKLSDDQIRQLLPQLRRFAFWLTQNETSADSLVQTCLEQQLTQVMEPTLEGNHRVWLFSTLYRKFLDDQRRTKHYIRLISFFQRKAPLSKCSIQSLVNGSDILEGFSKLNAEQRALLFLVTVEKLSYQEVADTLAIPSDKLAYRLSQARHALYELTKNSPYM